MSTKVKKKKKTKTKKTSSTVQGLMVLGACAAVGLFFFIVLSLFQPDSNNKVLHTNVGKSVVLNFPSRDNKEYRWELNLKKSEGLKYVNVGMIGWTYPKEKVKTESVFGGTRTARFSIKTKAAGKSLLYFEYRRSYTKDRPLRTKTVRVNINP